jgi:hypothetical protein
VVVEDKVDVWRSASIFANLLDGDRGQAANPVGRTTGEPEVRRLF